MLMTLVDVAVIVVVAAILVPVILYIRKAKKKGVKCIGCPDGVKCAGRCAGCSGNCCGTNEQ